jgi:FkbM family methyltransferase
MEPDEPTDVRRLMDAEVRAHLLAAYDLSTLGNAPNYDLRDPAERRRSVRDLERLFFQSVRALRPELFIEAGAKDARSSRRARRHLPDARIVAFEANPYVYERFRGRNAKRSRRVEYLHLALSDTPGEVTFNVRKGADGAPLADGRGSIKDLVEYEHGTEAVTVESTTLDTFFTGWDGGSCAMWIDVEGAAKEVLHGGHELLAKASLIFIEVEDRGQWVWGPAWTAGDVTSYLFDHGLVPVARDYQTRYQYNLLFASTDLLRDHGFRARLAIHRSGASGPDASASRQDDGGGDAGRFRRLLTRLLRRRSR